MRGIGDDIDGGLRPVPPSLPAISMRASWPWRRGVSPSYQSRISRTRRVRFMGVGSVRRGNALQQNTSRHCIPISQDVGYFQFDTARVMCNEGAILIRKLAVRTGSAPKISPGSPSFVRCSLL